MHEAFDDPDDLESDFFNANLSHKEAEREARRHQEKLGYWMVKNKYFRSHSINLLTFAEKEQIRHLHESDQQEWTAEKLAQSFPATEETIRKIIKSKWNARDSKRIEAHDKQVQKNWDALKEDKVSEMDAELREHLLKYADRKIDATPVPEINRDRLKLPMGEFSNIITSCKKIEEIKKEVPRIKSGVEDHVAPKSPMDQLPHPPPLNKYGTDTFLVDAIEDRRPMTIELFRTSSGLEPKVENNSTTITSSSNPSHIALGSRTGKVSMTPVPAQFQENKSQMIQFQEKISIPRKLLRRGATYKIEDNYYDDDGEFLYRVPGMVK